MHFKKYYVRLVFSSVTVIDRNNREKNRNTRLFELIDCFDNYKTIDIIPLCSDHSRATYNFL